MLTLIENKEEMTLSVFICGEFQFVLDNENKSEENENFNTLLSLLGKMNDDEQEEFLSSGLNLESLSNERFDIDVVSTINSITGGN